MAIAKDPELEAIVERVTAEVRRRLAGGASAAGGLPAPCAGCNGTTGCCQGASSGSGAAATGVCGGVSGGLASYIDHTLLKPEATRDDLYALCDEAKAHRFGAVCVNPTWVRAAKGRLRGTEVKTVAVIGFPLGAGTPAAKACEAQDAARAGADELDMVLNIGALRSGDLALVEQDIRAVVQAAAPVPVKVILETSKLTDEEKVIGCALSKVAGAAFVKTSTGFGGGGATVDDIGLMRRVVGDELGVKASGGVKTQEDACAMITAGATRIGASASVAIVTGKRTSSQGY